MNPLISVIVPVYNIEKYVKRCIDSVISQTYKNLEIILVDDGSTDKSGEICDEYEFQDNRVRVIHKTNGGLSDARNVAIDVAKGRWITFVDGDDFLEKTAIENMYKASMNLDVQIVCCLLKVVHKENVNFNVDYSKEKVTIYSKEKALERMFRQRELYCSACAKLYLKNLFQEVRYPKGELYEDLGTTYKLFALANNIALVRIEGYGYFVRTGSIQQSNFSYKKMAELRFAKEQKKYIDKKFPNLKMATTDRLVSSCFHILFSIIDSNEFEAEKKEVQLIIKKYRKALLFSKGTSKKTWFGCLLSYLGFPLEGWIYKALNIRGKMLS